MILSYMLYFIHVAVSLFLILVVLLQQGKGADLSVFGGGASQAAFGARGAATLLHKLTVICFIVFMITTLSIGVLQSRSSTVMRGAAADESTPASELAGGSLPDTDEDEASAASSAPGGSEAAAPAAEASSSEGTTEGLESPPAEGETSPPQ